MSFAEAFKQKRPGRIHDLAREVETTEDGVDLDVEKEVGDTEWGEMVKELDKRYDDLWHERISREDYFLHIIELARLRPDKRTEIRVMDRYDFWTDFSSDIYSSLPDSGAFDMIINAGIAQVLGDTARVKDLYTDRAWESAIEKFLLPLLKDKKWNQFLLLCDFFLSLDLDRVRRTIGKMITDAMWNDMGQKAREFRDKDKKFVSYTFFLSRMKLLCPERFQESSIQGDWPMLRDALRQFRESSEWRSFMSLAEAMQIMAAEAIVMTDHGFEYVQKKKQTHTEQIPPRPKRIAF